MIDHLPANKTLARRDAYYSIVLAPLEFVTSSLRKGDPWELRDLQDLANRCKALSQAFDDRMKELDGK